MAYLRWLRSNWCVYLHPNSGNTKDSQILAIWHIKNKERLLFSYAELKSIKNIKQLKKLIGIPDTDKSYLKLLKAIRQFVDEVKAKYPPKINVTVIRDFFWHWMDNFIRIRLNLYDRILYFIVFGFGFEFEFKSYRKSLYVYFFGWFYEIFWITEEEEEEE